MSDTPRMESALMDAPEVGFTNVWKVGCDIERELNAANVEMDEKRKDIVYLATEKAKLEERIKRLEEALDMLTCVIVFTPIKGNLAALQEAFDMARAVLKAKENKL